MKKTGNETRIIKTIGHYHIVRLYANAEYSLLDVKNEFPYYGDIYDREEEVLRDHPNAEVLKGYGLVDDETGYAPDETEDWYQTLEDAEDAVSALQSEETR